MAKRKYTRRKPVDHGPSLDTDGPSPAIADRPSIYEPDYGGRKWWILGIKLDDERNIIPFHNSAFAGIPWQQGTQKQIVEDGWLGLDLHRSRLTREILSADQVRRAASQIKQKVIRWRLSARDTPQGIVHRWASDILSLEHRIKTYDKKNETFVPAGYRYQPGENDVPISKYLVFIPKAKLSEFDGGNLYDAKLNNVPTMFDLDPSLIPDRMSRVRKHSAVGDEPW